MAEEQGHEGGALSGSLDHTKPESEPWQLGEPEGLLPKPIWARFESLTV